MKTAKKYLAAALMVCILTSLAPPPTAKAADNVITVDDGSTVTFTQYYWERTDWTPKDYLYFTVNDKVYYIYDKYNTRPLYKLAITNAVITTSIPNVYSVYNRWDDQIYCKQNIDDITTRYTMDSDSALTLIQNPVYPPGNGSGTPPIYRITTPKDTTPPSLTLSQSTRSPTNQPITITATATDNKALAALPYNFDNANWVATNTLQVTDNGTYTVQARDKVGNLTSKDITIMNIDKTPPTFFLAPLMAVGTDKVLIAVMAQDDSNAALQYSFDGGVTWQAEYTKELKTNVSVTIQVKDTVGNVCSETYVPTAPPAGGGGGGNTVQNIPLIVESNVELEKNIYGKKGIVDSTGTYKQYADAAKKGIRITIKAGSLVQDKFLAGNAVFAGKTYPIHWGTPNGALVVPATASTGYIYVDSATFTGNYKNARMRVAVGLYNDNTAQTKISEATSSINLTIDTAPPVININTNEATKLITIDTFDSISGVKDVLYKLDNGAFTRYTTPFKANGKQAITVVAVDKIENEARAVAQLNTTPDTVLNSINSNIYTYKSKNSIFFIVNGDKSNTKNINLADFAIG